MEERKKWHYIILTFCQYDTGSATSRGCTQGKTPYKSRYYWYFYHQRPGNVVDPHMGTNRQRIIHSSPLSTSGTLLNITVSRTSPEDEESHSGKCMHSKTLSYGYASRNPDVQTLDIHQIKFHVLTWKLTCEGGGSVLDQS